MGVKHYEPLRKNKRGVTVTLEVHPLRKPLFVMCVFPNSNFKFVCLFIYSRIRIKLILLVSRIFIGHAPNLERRAKVRIKNYKTFFKRKELKTYNKKVPTFNRH